MARAGLVGDVAYYGRLCDETADEGLYVGEVASAVVAHVDDQSLSVFQEVKHIVEVAFADGVGERRIVDIAYVFGQYAEFHSTCLAVVEVEI